MTTFIETFQRAVDTRDVTLLAPLLADDVELLGSVRAHTFEGKQAALFVFGMVMQLFTEVRYIAEYTGPEGLVLVLQGVVGGRPADGVQVLTVGTDGLIKGFRDFVRPLSATTALKDAAADYLARAAAAGPTPA